MSRSDSGHAGWHFLYSIQRGFATSGELMAIFRYVRDGNHGVMTAGPHAYEA